MRICGGALCAAVLVGMAVGMAGTLACAQNAAPLPTTNGPAAPGTNPAAAGPRGGQSDQAVQADALYKAQNFAAALPLYEDLHTRHPKENVWRERLAMCLVSAGSSNAERAANLNRAHSLLIEARESGDNSNLLQVMLEKLEAAAAAKPTGPVSPGMDALQRGDKAFSSGDLPGALKLYREAMEADPKLYEAPLFAGDAEYKSGHFAEAERWFGQAVAINPDRETAYRYWGDCLLKAGRGAEAEAKFIDAVIAEPYTQTPWVGLKQWADQAKLRVASPAIKLPPRQEMTASGGTVHLDGNAAKGPLGGAVAAYSLGQASYRFGGFAKAYPKETVYRDSLAEQAQSIRVGLSVLKTQKVAADQLDETWKALGQLDAEGMLECWIVLNHADQGVAQDYVAYRAEHRELLKAYVARYVIHQG